MIRPLLTAAALLALAGCSSSSDPAPVASPTRTTESTTPGPGAAPPETTPAPATGPDPSAAIIAVQLRTADLGAGYDVVPVPDEEAAGTLDLCYGTFPSEQKRAARQEVAVSKTEGDEVGRTDVVAYYSAADAEQALTEAEQAVSTCPKGTARPSAAGDYPDAVFSYRAAPDGLLSGLAADRFAVVETADYGAGQQRVQVRIYQRRGRILVVADALGTDPKQALVFARAAAGRLAALPPAAAGD